MSPRSVTVVCLLLAVGGCDREKELRSDECRAYGDWVSHAGDAMARAVPPSDKSAATTNAQEAAVYRRLAEGARESARTSIPFKDPLVKDLAYRRLKVFDAVAVALDHQADAWARGDKAAIQKALDEELRAQAQAPLLYDEWRHSCGGVPLGP